MTSAVAGSRAASGAPALLWRVIGVYLGLFWTWAGVAKAVAPTASYEFAARVVGGGPPAKSVVVASVVLEVVLGLALLTRAVSLRRGTALSLALLLAFSALLVVAKSAGGGALACGCFAFFATAAASVDHELWIDGGHAAVLALLLVYMFIAGRGSAGGAARGS